MISVKINGKDYAHAEIMAGHSSADVDPFASRVIKVIRDWEEGRDNFEFQTSGSTGTPKAVTIGRNKMLLSARATLEFLSIRKGTCFVCLDPDFIAGTMMIIRAIAGGLNLVAVSPSANPFKALAEIRRFELCALIPFQLYEILKDPASTEKLNKIRNILVGGADLSDEVTVKLSGFSNRIFQTFGMTETVSHVALKRLNGKRPDKYYHAVPGVEFFLDDRSCLVVKGKITDHQKLVTNDRIELMDNSRFKWLGRIDHVINTGGIKIQVEALEKKIEKIQSEQNLHLPFFLTGIPDAKFGQKLTIVYENNGKSVDTSTIRNILADKLAAFEMPRQWQIIEAFIRTNTGKIDRKASLKASSPAV